MRSENGQASCEWVGLVLLCSFALAALAAVVPASDGRSLGGLLVHRILCAVKGDCADRALRHTYGDRDAALLRRFAPGLVFEPGERQLPVDFRSCREASCAEAPDDPDLDAHRSHAGQPATVFTHLRREGGRTYLQYWFYYPDSNSAWGGSDQIWNSTPLRLVKGYPGYHRDDWEGFGVRLGRDGGAAVRTTSHGHWQWCKHGECERQWGPWTGWTRVSKGSHAGHVPTNDRRYRKGRAPLARRFPPALPGRDLRERTSTPDAMVLVPLEGLGRARRRYRRNDDGISPPWEKQAYSDPESDAS